MDDRNDLKRTRSHFSSVSLILEKVAYACAVVFSQKKLEKKKSLMEIKEISDRFAFWYFVCGPGY